MEYLPVKKRGGMISIVAAFWMVGSIYAAGVCCVPLFAGVVIIPCLTVCDCVRLCVIVIRCGMVSNGCVGCIMADILTDRCRPRVCGVLPRLAVPSGITSVRHSHSHPRLPCHCVTRSLFPLSACVCVYRVCRVCRVCRVRVQVPVLQARPRQVQEGVDPHRQSQWSAVIVDGGWALGTTVACDGSILHALHHLDQQGTVILASCCRHSHH